MFSIITTEPSTTMPKSSAPSESRLAGMWLRSRQMEANSSAKGMVSATMMAPRTLPRKRKRMIETRIMPSVRLCSTVSTVYFTRSERSRKGTTFTPLGRMPLIRACRLPRGCPARTGSESSPFCSSTMPSTVSGLSTIAAVGPMRRAADLAQANLGPLRDGGDVLDADGRAILRLDDGVFDVLHAGVEAQRLHIDLLRALLDEAAAAVGVVVGDLLLDLADAKGRRRPACPDRAGSGTPWSARRSSKHRPRRSTLLKDFSSVQSSSDFFSITS